VNLVVPVLATGVLAVPIEAQSLWPELGDWVAAVEGHLPGLRDASIDYVAPWTDGDFDTIAGELHRKGVLSQQADGLEPAFLHRAALLHAEVAMLHRGPRGYSLPGSEHRRFALAYDGRPVSAWVGTRHWSFGRELLDRLDAEGDADLEDDFALLWYRAVAAFLQSWNEFAELEPHLRRGRKIFPRDPVLLLHEGTLHEAYAEPRIQRLYRSSRRTRRRIGDVGDELAKARTALEEALRIDPGLDEARIRLARVRGLEGDHEGSAALLRECVERPLSPLMRYYAHLFLGREEHVLGRLDSAAVAYERAIELYPEAQSPRLGLGQLAWDRGDRGGTLASIAQLDSRDPEATDPLWTYNRVHAPDVAELFAELRRRLAP